MRKKARRPSASKSPKKRALQLSQETVRKLSSDELSQAAAGCPNNSRPTTLDQDTSNCPI